MNWKFTRFQTRGQRGKERCVFGLIYMCMLVIVLGVIIPNIYIWWRYNDCAPNFINFPIMNCPFMCSNILAAPAYGVYISQLKGCSRACGSYQDFLDRWFLLIRKILNHGFLFVKLKSSLRKFYGDHHDLVDSYGIYVWQMTMDMFHLS